MKTGCASTVDKSWLEFNDGKKRIDLLPHEEKTDLASMWVEAREWDRFANHRASHLSDYKLSTRVDPDRMANGVRDCTL
jgi:hypothetical protein